MLLRAQYVEKPWGRRALPAPFVNPSQASIGEIWFSAPGAQLPLMIKYLFTSAALSVQVHPDDDQARARGHAHGKDECWYILDAEPGARLAIGTRESLDQEALRAAARDGSIVELLQWHEAVPGHMFEIPSGTVHAIGGGISLIEVQQNIDLTYRLHDYGSSRELHVDDGVAVAQARPYDAALHYQLAPGAIVTRPHYHVALAQGALIELPGTGPHYALPIAGEIACNGATARPGDCLLVESIGALHPAADGRTLLARAR